MIQPQLLCNSHQKCLSSGLVWVTPYGCQIPQFLKLFSRHYPIFSSSQQSSEGGVIPFYRWQRKIYRSNVAQLDGTAGKTWNWDLNWDLWAPSLRLPDLFPAVSPTADLEGCICWLCAGWGEAADGWQLRDETAVPALWGARARLGGEAEEGRWWSECFLVYFCISFFYWGIIFIEW